TRGGSLCAVRSRLVAVAQAMTARDSERPDERLDEYARLSFFLTVAGVACTCRRKTSRNRKRPRKIAPATEGPIPSGQPVCEIGSSLLGDRKTATTARNKKATRCVASCIGTGERTRTFTTSLPADFESAASTIPPHRHRLRS